MKNALTVRDELKDKLAEKPLMLLLDYDGTLAPIAQTPDQALIPESTRTLLEKFVKIPQCKAVIVSGRAWEDVKKMVGIKNIIYVGNHGLEISGPGNHFENAYFPKYRKALNRVIAKLAKPLMDMPEVLIEDKKITLSIHVRRLDPVKKPIFKKVLSKIIGPFVRSKSLKLRAGKEVYELLPPIEWDKGKAVSWILRSNKNAETDQDLVVIYIGDDQTDEDAFRALKKKAITINIGFSRYTSAEYFLESPQEVGKFLGWIVDLKGRRG
jgi:trehalose-phosphatase